MLIVTIKSPILAIEQMFLSLVHFFFKLLVRLHFLENEKKLYAKSQVHILGASDGDV